jgi:TonB-dependent SusC/RagA subfamily outer membrane receptor
MFSGNNPLYIVDDVPMNNINLLNPEDIASIEILKDASATALYGIRGANGVVLIKTKKGGEDLGELCKAVKIAMFSSVVMRTRVDTGRLRGNWQIQESAPANGELDRLDKNGSIVSDEVVAKSTARGHTFFVNNLPYAKVYEEKDAMVATSIAKVKNNISKVFVI